MSRNDMLEDFSRILLIFLASFISIKAIFIIFFNTPFDPPFLLHLSPLYIFDSVTALQLLTVSFLLVVIDLYLHIRGEPSSRILSLVITAIMLSGLSISVAYSEINMNMFIEYIIFISLLSLMMADLREFIIPKKIPYTRTTRRLTRTGGKKTEHRDSISSFHKAASDLVLLNDIDREHIEILNDIGIKNVDDLANMDASKLVKDFRNYMKELEDTISSLTEEKLEGWIENAKSLISERNRFRNA